MPLGKGKRRASQQENQRDKTKIENVKKRKREENRQCDKQAKRRKIEWLRDIRSILRSSGKKLEFPKNFSERKLIKMQKEKKKLKSHSIISDKNKAGPSGKSRDNYINTMIELENRCIFDQDSIASISSGSSLVEVNDAPFVNQDYGLSNELDATRGNNLINQVQENIQCHNLINQVQDNNQSYIIINQLQENSPSPNQNDQAEGNSHYDNVSTTSDTILNSNGYHQSTNFEALIEIRRLPSTETDNTVIESESNVNIDMTNSDIEPFVLPSTELIDDSNSINVSSAEDQNNERSEIQGHNSNMESGDHNHNQVEVGLNDSCNYWNFNSNRDYDDRIFYFGAATNEMKKGTNNIANFSFASQSNNLSENQDLQPDGVNEEMEVERNNTVHLQGGEYNTNYRNELNRNTMQINDLSKCLLYPTDTLVYNNNNQHSSGDENVNQIETFHHQNSLAYYDNNTGAFLRSSSLQNNTSTSQSLKNTWGSIKNLLSRVSGQKTSDNQQMEEENDPEGPP